MPDLWRHRSRHTVEMDTGKDWSEDMSAIFDLEEWKKIAIRSTSGDQVWDIIASWEADSKSLSARLQRVIHEVQKYQPSGSPPPGDEAMLTRWIMSSLTASRDA